jgi:hypothetical protein
MSGFRWLSQQAEKYDYPEKASIEKSVGERERRAAKTQQ